MEITTITSADFNKQADKLVELYTNAFASGKSFQHQSKLETINYLQAIFNVGYGIVAQENNQLLGCILITPLTFDELVPDQISKNFDLSRSAYIAEMMVQKEYQGLGIGKQLLRYFKETIDTDKYDHAFIRVWVENSSAIALYKKMGFSDYAFINHQKVLGDKSTTFNFKKSYLHQKIK